MKITTAQKAFRPVSIEIETDKEMTAFFNIVKQFGEKHCSVGSPEAILCKELAKLVGNSQL